LDRMKKVWEERNWGGLRALHRDQKANPSPNQPRLSIDYKKIQCLPLLL